MNVSMSHQFDEGNDDESIDLSSLCETAYVSARVKDLSWIHLGSERAIVH